MLIISKILVNLVYRMTVVGTEARLEPAVFLRYRCNIAESEAGIDEDWLAIGKERSELSSAFSGGIIVEGGKDKAVGS